MTCELTTIPAALHYTLNCTVTPDMTASALGNPTAVQVLATPVVLGLFESAAAQALLPYLPEACVIVGVDVTLTHMSPTPVGCTAEVHAELKEQHRNKFIWTLQAQDEYGPIASGILVSAVLSKESLTRRIREKTRPAH